MAEQTVIRHIVVRGSSEGMPALTSDLKKVAEAHKDVTIAIEGSEKSQLSAAKAFERQQRTNDLAFRQQQEMAKTLAVLDRAKRQGIGTDEEHARVLQGLAQRQEAVNRGQKSLVDTTKLSRYEMINLSRQVQDVGVSLASGQSPFTVLVQQGTQIADVFASSQTTVRQFFTSAIGWAGRFAVSAGGIVTGVAAIGGAALLTAANFQTAQTEVNRVLIGIGRQSGATALEIQKISEATAKPTGLSISETRQAAIEFAKTGQIGVEQFGMLADAAFKASKILGIDLAEANKLFAQSFADPAKGVDDLGARLGGVTARMREDIKSLAAQMRMPEAQQALQQAIIPTLERAREVTTTWSQAWTAIGNKVSNFFDTMGKGLSRIAGQNPIEEQIARTRSELDSLASQRIDAERRPTQGGVLSLRGGDEAAASLKRLDEAIAVTQTKLLGLEDQLKKTNEEAAKAPFTKLGKQMADIANAVAPGVQQLQRMRDALSALQKGLSDPRMLETMREGQVRAAREAEAALSSQLKFIDAARDSYKGLTAESAVQVKLLNDQVNVANALGTSARLVAQEEALVNQHRAQGKSLLDATALASAQIAAMKAQEVAQAREAVAAARDQLSVAQAVTDAAKIEAQAAAEAAAARRQLSGNPEAQAQALQAIELRRQATYAAINSQAEQTLTALERQEAVAGAVTNQAKLLAQEEARYLELVDRGVASNKALAIASQERANEQAQINAGAEQQLRTLQQQNQLINAIDDEEKARIQSNITLQNLLEQGVDAMTAQQVAAQQLKNSIDQIAASEARAADQADRMAAAHKRARGDASATGFVSSTGSGSTVGRSAEGNIAGTDEMLRVVQRQQAEERGARFELEGPWRLPVVTETDESLRRIINDMLRAGRGIGDAIDQLMREGQNSTLPEDLRIQTLLDLMRRQTEELGSPAKEIEMLKRQIDLARNQPRTLERDDLIKALNDRLKALTEATDDLTSTMKLGLDPIYTQGHDALKIGYYSEGGGGRHQGTDWARPPPGSVPVNPAQVPVPAPPGMTPPGPTNWGKQNTMEEWLKRSANTAIWSAQYGLSGIVSGTGGTDSTLVQMMATPGERVTVTPPSGSAYSGPNQSWGKSPEWYMQQMREAQSVGPTHWGKEQYLSSLPGQLARLPEAIGEAVAQATRDAPSNDNNAPKTVIVNLPPGRMLSDRQTRRQAADGMGRAIAARF